VTGFVLFGFIAVLAFRSQPANPDARLPNRFRLVGLIHREQQQTRDLRVQADALRAELDTARQAAAHNSSGASQVEAALRQAETAAGLVAVSGPGLKVVLDDSSQKESPTGNVNDLVIHSQDVQAVVNALWRAGAEAVSASGERLVSTSAVLCVGNTLLLNGTVHSPPYVILAVGAVSERFEADRLVQQLHDDADAFGLRFSVSKESDLHVPAFAGPATPRYAKPSGG
jgi:uncharacterized protein YlxW (UPF0749 family)